MAIKSDPFGGVELTGEDAEAFLRQVEQGPTKEQQRIIAEAIKRGRAMAAELAKNGHVLVGGLAAPQLAREYMEREKDG